LTTAISITTNFTLPDHHHRQQDEAQRIFPIVARRSLTLKKIAYPANGSQKLIEIEDERRLRVFMDKRVRPSPFLECQS